MKLIEADKVEQAIKDYWKAQVDKALTLTDGNKKRIDIYLEHNHELLKAIDELPSAEPDTTTHDSIPAETGKNDGDGTSGDCISRQAAYLALVEKGQASKRYKLGETWELNGEEIREVLDTMPSAQPEMNCSEIPNNWIPCSERLPEIDKEVLVTDGELCWVCSLFESQDIEDGLYQWEDNYGHWREFETWVAWIPLPKPYQGGGEQE